MKLDIKDVEFLDEFLVLVREICPNSTITCDLINDNEAIHVTIDRGNELLEGLTRLDVSLRYSKFNGHKMFGVECLERQIRNDGSLKFAYTKIKDGEPQ